MYLSDYMIPIVIFYIVGFGLLMKKDIFDSFLRGAKEGFQVVADIAPTLIALLTAIGILRASGGLDALADFLTPVLAKIHFSGELVPLALMKMVSSSAATGLLLDIFREYGVDSYLGKAAAIMMSSTETIFYTMSVYFSAVQIKKTRYTLAGALVATFAGIAASVILAGM